MNIDHGMLKTHIILHSIIVIMSTVRLIKLRDVRSSSNPMFDRISVVGLTQAEQAFSLLTAVIPMIQNLLDGFNTRMPSIDQRGQSRQTGIHAGPRDRTNGFHSTYGSEDNIIRVVEEFDVRHVAF